MTTMRVLGVDLGEKRTGLAISDPLGFTAQGLATIYSQDKKVVLEKLVSTCAEHSVGEIVIGLPKNMDGSLGPKAKEVLAFVAEAEKVMTIPLKVWDERLTSRQGQRLMVEQGLSRRKQKENSDEIAAILILQSYLEFKRGTVSGSGFCHEVV